MDLSKEINGKTIYLQNGFRLFNLPINAKPSKVNSEFNKIEAMINLNDLSKTEPLMDVYQNSPFQISPRPNYLDYQNAKNKLSESRSRLIEEVFWFWPEDLNDKKDPTVRSLKKGDVDGALSVWNSSNAANAAHNLAVYNHVLAVDAEMAGGPSSSQQYWREALSQWYRTLSSGDFKNLVIMRVQQLDDATMRQDYVEEVFSQLAVAVLSINASFANEYYKDGNTSSFGRHIDIIKGSDFDKATKDMALKDIFDSLYDSLNDKFEEFDKQEYSKQSDIPKIERFLASIDDDVTILKQHFSDDAQFQMLSDNIAKSVKGKYVYIVNEADSFDGFDLDKISRVFRGLVEMAYTVTVKDEIENNLEQLQNIMKSQGDDKIHKKIVAFLEDIENQTVTSAKRYSRDMQSELDSLDSPNKNDLSDGFAISLDGFVVTQINKAGDNVSKILSDKDDLEELLRTARRYATDSDTRQKIDKSMEFFTDQVPLLEQLVKGGVDVEKLMKEQSKTTTTKPQPHGGGGGGGKGGLIGCIIIIAVIFLAAAYFLGFIG